MVCRIFQKAGPGPQNGAQYGAPFVEEEWEEDDADVGLLPVEGDAAVDPEAPRAPVQIPGALERGYLQMSDLIQVWLQAVNLHVLFFLKKNSSVSVHRIQFGVHI